MPCVGARRGFTEAPGPEPDVGDRVISRRKITDHWHKISRVIHENQQN